MKIIYFWPMQKNQLNILKKINAADILDLGGDEKQFFLWSCLSVNVF